MITRYTKDELDALNNAPVLPTDQANNWLIKPKVWCITSFRWMTQYNWPCDCPVYACRIGRWVYYRHDNDEILYKTPVQRTSHGYGWRSGTYANIHWQALCNWLYSLHANQSHAPTP